jgi:tetratricopeptide (TPR) repeat protein
MSLLLEALKKAERAKEEAQRRARGEGQPAEDPKHVLTRSELPDIKQPLEILSDDLTPKESESAPAIEEPATQAALRPAPQPQSESPKQTEAQATAKKVFQAKFKEPNPRLPFFITLGMLGAFALGTVGYFWYQLRPPPPLVNANPKPPAREQVTAAPEAKPAAAVPAASVAAPAIPGLPMATPVKPLPVAEKPAPVAEVAPQRTPRPAPVPRAAAPRQIEPAVVPSRLPPQVHPKVASGYSAYLAGDLAAARTLYQEALREDGANRDALLGLAAIDVRSGRHEAAEATYLRLLQADPNDAHAQSGLIALRSGRLDPLATESRVKSLLAADPGANVLHFTLGNQLAAQGRWAEAQHEYFKAFAAEPDNADFAYNLAVSLDHLRQSGLALEYYRRAIALAEKRGASFDLTAARERAAQLGD